jgi:replicative DNA helicase Mcm
VSNSDASNELNASLPVIKIAKPWISETYAEQISALADAYDDDDEVSLRGESINLSIKDYVRQWDEDQQEEVKDGFIKGRGTVEGSAVESVRRLIEEEIDDDVDVGSPNSDGWSVRWTDPVDEMEIDISGPLSRRTGEMVAIRARVRHRTDPVPWFRSRHYECERCMTEIRTPLSYTHENIVRGDIQSPNECRNETCSAGPDDFRVVTERSDMRDYQYLTVEQSPGVDGSTPSKIGCWLFGEGRLTDASEGERVTVIGRLKLNPDSEPSEHYVMARSVATDRDDDTVEVSDDDRDRVREIVNDSVEPLETAASSLAPTVHGHELAKRGLILVGVGSGLDDKDEQTHAMLIGDPGTAKTELTSAVRDVIPSTRQASLTQSSSVGLTASAVQETVGGTEEWVIRAGALSLASGGILTIDELDEADFDLSKLNDALSEGEIPVDKAGESTKIKTDTRVIATANPAAAEFAPHEPLGDQIQFTADVVSRFDLAFPFIDDASDEEMNEGIMRATAADYLEGDELSGEYVEYEPEIDQETMRKWIAVAQEHQPTITQEAMDEINQAWMILRDTSDGGAININPRRLRSVIRLARAHSRLRLGDEVTAADARTAFRVVSAMLGEWGYDMEGDSSPDDSGGNGDLGDDYGGDYEIPDRKLGAVKDLVEEGESAEEIVDTLQMSDKAVSAVRELVGEYDGDGLGEELAQTGGDRQ